MAGPNSTFGRAGGLVALAALAASIAVRAQDGPEPGTTRRATDPVDLAARQIRAWGSGDERWVLLSGEAAVLQEGDGLRADQAAIRVTTLRAGDSPSYQLEVYAEGNVRPTGSLGAPRRSLRVRFETENEVRFKPYEPSGMVPQAGPPRWTGLLARGFPRPTPAAVTATTTPPAATSPAPAIRGEVVAPPPGTPDSLPVGAPPVPEFVARLGSKSPDGSAPAPASAPSPAPAPDRTSAPAPAPEPPSETQAPEFVPVPASSPETGPEGSPSEAPRPAAAEIPLAPPEAPPPIPAESPSLAPEAGSLPDPVEAPSPSPAAEAGPGSVESPTPAPVSPTEVAGPAPVPTAPGGAASPPVIEAKVTEPEVEPTQFEEQEPIENPYPLSPEPMAPEAGPVLPPIDFPPVLGDEGEGQGGLGPGGPNPPTSLEPLPGDEGRPLTPKADGPTPAPPAAPIFPGSQRTTSIFPRSGGPGFTIESIPRSPDGTETYVIRGGVNIVIHNPKPIGTIDVTADSAIIWRKPDPEGGQKGLGPEGELVESSRQPMEVYLEGHVVFRQDERVVAGNGDQKTYRAEKVYFNVQSDRLVAINAEVDMFAPGFLAPVNMKSPRIEQYRPLERAADGKLLYGLQEIHADRTVLSGSRFPTPGYRFTSRSVDVHRVVSSQADPNSGTTVGNPDDPNAPQDLTWRIDARQNFFYLGALPVFYWPRFVADADDLDPPLQQIVFRTNNYFGQQLLTDWNMFKLLGVKRPQWIDRWNLDVDYLSERGVAAGSEIGWFGKDLLRDLSDPYHRDKRAERTITGQYYGYFDIWGLRDSGIDVLGSGPAIVTDPPGAGKRGYQRTGVPPFQDFRGRFNFRHMQSFLGPDADPYEDFHLQVEAAYTSDRHFLEEYYKRLFDVGYDQETLALLTRQHDNSAWTVHAEANLQSWLTDTQWLPKLDYYRLGDSLLGNLFTHYQHSGIDYANTHTASEVNNPNVFAFLPYDPISNTSRPLETARAFTSHEIDLPIRLNAFRVVPYAQGQVVGWTNQIDGRETGRLWGAVGARADIMAWKAYRGIESELLNIHGVNHKINLQADYRTAYSNLDLNRIGVQDDLDDNTYELVRRYFAMSTYAGGILPGQYDPRHLIARRAISPITGTTDVQTTIETLQLGIHQRLQTKRGPEGKRRIIDFMTLDLTTTYFPHADRDNFGKPFGQNMYNWEWFIGDRTSIISYGWFEFFDITGDPLSKQTTERKNNPFGLNIITSGISISRPPRTNLFIGYTVIDTGVINTSALNSSISYWLSPKWYGTYATSYDFGNAILLAANFSVTRIGADYLTSLGLSVDPQRQSYMFAVELQPRISPNIRFGSTAGMNTFDSRYAPTQ